MWNPCPKAYSFPVHHVGPSCYVIAARGVNLDTRKCLYRMLRLTQAPRRPLSTHSRWPSWSLGRVLNSKFAKVIIFSAIGLMILTALSALVNKAAMGGNGDYAIFNLKRRRAGVVTQL